MTILPSQLVRDNLNIDTMYRGFLYSTLLLLKVNKNPLNPVPQTNNPFYNAVRLSPSSTTGLITISIRYQINRTGFLEDALDYILNIQPYGNSDPGDDFAATPPTSPNATPLPDDPVYITNLEKYNVWTALLIQSTHLSLATPDTTTMVIQYLDESLIENEPTVQISAVLPFSAVNFACFGNLVRSLDNPLPIYTC